MSEKRNIPALRFKGFTDAWEQRKLGEIVTRIVRKNENNETNLPLTISAEYGLVDQVTFFNNRVASSNLAGYYLLYKGDFAYNKSTSLGATWGTIKRLELYDKGAVSTLYIVFKPLENIDSTYLLYFYETDKWHKDVRQIAAEGARNHGLLNISADDFFKTTLNVPSLEEQRKIGEMLSKVSTLITLHQRKLDKLCNIKKSLLEKMFPQEGKSVPALRFKGFTDAWEQRKLEDYLIVSKEINSNEEFTKDDVLSVSGEFGVVNQIEFQGRSFAGNSVVPYGVVRTGDVIYTKSPLRTNPFGIIKTNKLTPGIVSTLYAVYHPKENVDSCFVHVYFEQNARVNNYLHPLVNKGAKNDMKVSDENALKGNVIFPSRREQSAICVIFERLDTLITLHQRKVEKLKNLKSALLEKMFV